MSYVEDLENNRTVKIKLSSNGLVVKQLSTAINTMNEEIEEILEVASSKLSDEDYKARLEYLSTFIDTKISIEHDNEFIVINLK